MSHEAEQEENYFASPTSSTWLDGKFDAVSACLWIYLCGVESHLIKKVCLLFLIV